WGRTYRACAEDAGMAALLGVAVERVVALAFAVGAGLAALSGTMIALYYGEAGFSIGYLICLKALTAAHVCGVRSVVGARRRRPSHRPPRGAVVGLCRARLQGRRGLRRAGDGPGLPAAGPPRHRSRGAVARRAGAAVSGLSAARRRSPGGC